MEIGEHVADSLDAQTVDHLFQDEDVEALALQRRGEPDAVLLKNVDARPLLRDREHIR